LSARNNGVDDGILRVVGKPGFQRGILFRQHLNPRHMAPFVTGVILGFLSLVGTDMKDPGRVDAEVTNEVGNGDHHGAISSECSTSLAKRGREQEATTAVS
jgi:hypothetical protein